MQDHRSDYRPKALFVFFFGPNGPSLYHHAHQTPLALVIMPEIPNSLSLPEFPTSLKCLLVVALTFYAWIGRSRLLGVMARYPGTWVLVAKQR